MRRQAQKKSNLYIYPAGVSPACSGLEIKDRETAKEKDAAKQLKGFFVPQRGFFSNAAAAFDAAETERTLQRYLRRVNRYHTI